MRCGGLVMWKVIILSQVVFIVNSHAFHYISEAEIHSEEPTESTCFGKVTSLENNLSFVNCTKPVSEGHTDSHKTQEYFSLVSKATADVSNAIQFLIWFIAGFSMFLTFLGILATFSAFRVIPKETEKQITKTKDQIQSEIAQKISRSSAENMRLVSQQVSSEYLKLFWSLNMVESGIFTEQLASLSNYVVNTNSVMQNWVVKYLLNNNIEEGDLNSNIEKIKKEPIENTQKLTKEESAYQWRLAKIPFVLCTLLMEENTEMEEAVQFLESNFDEIPKKFQRQIQEFIKLLFASDYFGPKSDLLWARLLRFSGGKN